MLAPVSFRSQLMNAIQGVLVVRFGPIVPSEKCTSAPVVVPLVGMSASS